jgi:Ca-activated chloride channel family protein
MRTNLAYYPGSSPYPAGLTALTGQKLALKSVRAVGRLEGLIFEMTLHQKFVNETRDNLEIVYTLPLPFEAELMGLEAKIGEKTYSAEVREKKAASEQYEKAMEEGNGAILVEESQPGVYTINLGNLMPGEEAEVEISFAQHLSYDQDSIRLTVPTVIAPCTGIQ